MALKDQANILLPITIPSLDLVATDDSYLIQSLPLRLQNDDFSIPTLPSHLLIILLILLLARALLFH